MMILLKSVSMELSVVRSQGKTNAVVRKLKLKKYGLALVDVERTD